DEGDGSGTGTIAAGSERDRISPKPEKGEPFPSEGSFKEPSNKEPLTYDSTQTQSSLLAAVRQPLDKPTQSLQIEQTVQKRFALTQGDLEEPFYKEPALKEGSRKVPYEITSFPSSAAISATTTPGHAAPDTFREAFEVLPTLGPLEQLLYLWFLNLSHAVGQP